MRKIAQAAFLFLLGVTAVEAAEQFYEVGGMAGGGLLNTTTLTSTAGSATAGFKPGAVFGVLVGNQMYSRLSGEARYLYQMSDLKLASGGTEVTFGGQTHLIHYDLIYQVSPRQSKVKLFIAGGGGVKVFRGTGTEAAYQPLGNFAYLTKTRQVEPMLSVGGGMKVPLNPHTFLRVEIRDFLSPFPDQVIAPAPHVSGGGWLHDLVPTVGISYTFK
ncbi:MAG: outer membrane beta-barrel protein [Acidobacteria bacterium]|nr:outer membrane beta-barrel protein [Acidobacteriota bacterium]